MLHTTCLARKFRDHQERAIGLGECLPPWLWVADDGTPEGFIVWTEYLDGLATLVAYCAAHHRPVILEGQE